MLQSLQNSLGRQYLSIGRWGHLLQNLLFLQVHLLMLAEQKLHTSPLTHTAFSQKWSSSKETRILSFPAALSPLSLSPCIYFVLSLWQLGKGENALVIFLSVFITLRDIVRARVCVCRRRAGQRCYLHCHLQEGL